MPPARLQESGETRSTVNCRHVAGANLLNLQPLLSHSLPTDRFRWTFRRNPLCPRVFCLPRTEFARTSLCLSVTPAPLLCDLPTTSESHPMINHRILLPASTLSARPSHQTRSSEPTSPTSAGHYAHDPYAYCHRMARNHLLPPPNRQAGRVASCSTPCNNLQKRPKHRIINYPCWVAPSVLSHSLNANHESRQSHFAINPHIHHHWMSPVFRITERTRNSLEASCQILARRLKSDACHRVVRFNQTLSKCQRCGKSSGDFTKMRHCRNQPRSEDPL